MKFPREGSLSSAGGGVNDIYIYKLGNRRLLKDRNKVQWVPTNSGVRELFIALEVEATSWRYV